MRSGNPLLRLRHLGQAVWLDYIRRELLVNGEIARLIADDGVAGMTSNPAIFENAIAQHHDYDPAIALLARAGIGAAAICETLEVEDVRSAADLLRPVYEQTGQRDGYVSLEVTPHVANDTEATVMEAQRLWARVARPNLMIKVPATPSGLPAIRRLIASGVNVNITLLFGIARYREVVDAYMGGLEDRARAGGRLAGLASVASFFLSRIDTLVDQRLDLLDTDASRQLRGGAAIASARLAFQACKALAAGQRWRALAAQGAQPQRLLWASTSTKDPACSDVKYVEALIGPGTVNTLPPETLAAYRDHGDPAVRLEQDLDSAGALPGRLAALGIDLGQLAERLEEEGVRKFIDPYDRLHAALERRVSAAAQAG